MSRVVVYLYSGRWIPIMFCSLGEAIQFHRQARLEGQQIYVFPSNVDPSNYQAITDTQADCDRNPVRLIETKIINQATSETMKLSRLYICQKQRLLNKSPNPNSINYNPA